MIRKASTLRVPKVLNIVLNLLMRMLYTLEHGSPSKVDNIRQTYGYFAILFSILLQMKYKNASHEQFAHVCLHSVLGHCSI